MPEEGIIPPAVITPPVETPIEPVAPVTAPIPEPPKEPDYEAISKKIETTVSDKVSKSVIEKIGDALGLTKKQTEEILPTDPKELKKYIDDAGKKQAQAILDERDKLTTQTKEQEEAKIQEGAKNFQTMWSRDYTEMANLKMVPPITKADDKNDPGNIAKTKILYKLNEILKENSTNGIDYVPTLWEIMSRFPNVLRTETTAGGSAPISGGGRTMGGGVDADYNRIHATSVEDMVKAKVGA